MKKRIRGEVTSDKMDKTIVVSTERWVRHPRYGKYLRRHSSFMAHDAHEEAREGDTVEIEETRPLSKKKRWRLVRIVERSEQAKADRRERESTA